LVVADPLSRLNLRNQARAAKISTPAPTIRIFSVVSLMATPRKPVI
jgi:hypothetical protein